MIVKKIVNQKSQRLSTLLEKELGLGYSAIQKLIRKKDVKIHGVRVSKDIDLTAGEDIEVYIKEEKPNIIYEDDDIIVAFKPSAIETINESGNDFKSVIENFLNLKLFVVHRLDRNTEGLVIFAKNEEAKKSLDSAIKNRSIQKFYLAKVIGLVANDEEQLIGYLKKDAKNSRVFISDLKQEGYEKIQTNYRVVKTDNEFSILEVELVTGKTHQIRAHLSHIGYPILGDDKYGIALVNKKYKKHRQCLCAYKLIFHFDKKDYLFRLNGIVVELEKNKINFLK